MTGPAGEGERAPLRVDHFSTRTGGGAGAGARRLHEALLEQGVDSRFWYWRRGGPETPGGRRVVLWGDGPWPAQVTDRLVGRIRRARIKGRLKAARKGAPPGLELFTPPRVGWATPFSARRFTGHVVHLHWVAGLLDLPTFFASLPAGRPVVWTLRDMNPFTGGCHFSGGCDGYARGCGSCPQLGRPHPDDLSADYHRLKAGALEGAALHVVAPSRWMLEQARRSPVFGQAASFTWIPTGVETDVFRPGDRAAARRDLGLDAEGPVVAFGSERLDNVRKGLAQGLEALARLSHVAGLRVLTFGQELPERSLPPSLEVRSVGYVADPARLATVYAAADCFVLPSLEDNLPKTGLEALACGTPVVAFRAGGIPDFVVHGETGLLAAVGNAADLARQLERALADPAAAAAMGVRGRKLVERAFSAPTQARAQAEHYRSVLDGLARD